ncbi:uncharacterized protein LOC100378999 [Saccoglossus kowalevskii]|uniref:Uncharacterized protein LOC100378999 n=1 Tax=Saccoglossus kowalevskii TaxID=10224 RepID=A0ABM0GJG6_SACKO|nr:PREDICTED: uncharacterized protein LOC100378999 [Saccoglossus kowalevskii]
MAGISTDGGNRNSSTDKMSKRAWGTVTKPPSMDLGWQKMTNYEIDQTVERLYYVPKPKSREYKRQNPQLTEDQITDMMERLTKNAGDKAPDARRIAEGPLKDMGVVNSFAWKGYN